MLRTLPAPIVLALSACHVGFHDHIKVDGVRLPAHHEEVLTLEAWAEGGLVIQAHQGDLRVELGEGPTTLIVTVHERTPGEARAYLEEGKLIARADNGETCAIGDVILRTAGPIPGLHLSTGMGDVEVRRVRVDGRLDVSTGMGDIDIFEPGAPKVVSISTGMGDIVVGQLVCERIEASTGMGDVSISAIEAEAADFSSGMGDVEIERSKGGHVKAGTGLGDVEVVESRFATRDLDSGLGSVSER